VWQDNINITAKFVIAIQFVTNLVPKATIYLRSLADSLNDAAKEESKVTLMGSFKTSRKWN